MYILYAEQQNCLVVYILVTKYLPTLIKKITKHSFSSGYLYNAIVTKSYQESALCIYIFVTYFTLMSIPIIYVLEM